MAERAGGETPNLAAMIEAMFEAGCEYASRRELAALRLSGIRERRNCSAAYEAFEAAKDQITAALPWILLSMAKASKRKRTPSVPGVASLPNFAESLRGLVQDQRYSAADIGPMFGVSAGRIAQLRNRFGIARPSHVGKRAVHVWDDGASRFVAIPRNRASGYPARCGNPKWRAQFPSSRETTDG